MHNSGQGSKAKSLSNALKKGQFPGGFVCCSLEVTEGQLRSCGMASPCQNIQISSSTGWEPTTGHPRRSSRRALGTQDLVEHDSEELARCLTQGRSAHRTSGTRRRQAVCGSSSEFKKVQRSVVRNATGATGYLGPLRMSLSIERTSSTLLPKEPARMRGASCSCNI